MNATITTLAVYQKKSAAVEREIVETIRQHQNLLIAKGYIAENPPIILRDADFFIELIAWTAGSAEKAQKDADVGKIWKIFESLVDFKVLADLPNAKTPFADFTPQAFADQRQGPSVEL